MQDAYVTGINAAHSVVWDTESTPGCGGCGCDKCTGEFKYISQGVNQFGDRSRALGWERTKTIWAVSQGGSSYRSRIPTGKEWVVQSLLDVTHGALGPFFSVHLFTTGLPYLAGITPWNDPTSSDVKAAAGQ